MMSTSTALSLWDRFRGRFKITTSYSFTGQEGGSQKITVFNLNNMPIIIEYYEIYWKKRGYFKKKTPIDIGLEDACNLRVLAHDFITLEFDEGRDFDWGHGSRNSECLFMQINIAGRKPLTKLIYK